MKLREYKSTFYTQLPKALVTTFKIKRFDKISIIPHRYQLTDTDGIIKQNHIQLLIIVNRAQNQRGYNPPRSFVKLSVPKNLVELFNYQIGQILTPILYENNNDHVILQIAENIEVSPNIPEFLNLSFKSVLSRIKRQKKRRKNEVSETEAALGKFNVTEPYSHGYQSDIAIEPETQTGGSLLDDGSDINKINPVTDISGG